MLDEIRGEVIRQHRAGVFDVEHRHAIDRRCLVGLRGRIGYIVGANDEGHIGAGELGIDVVEFEQLNKFLQALQLEFEAINEMM